MQRWDDSLWLFTQEEFNKLPDGFVLTSINGAQYIKGKDRVDMDIRFNHIAYGVRNPLNHPDAELFTTFMLQS